MRITFFNEESAKSAVQVWENHGFGARRQGKTVFTDCPTLWAVPMLNRAIGFREIASLEVTPGPVPVPTEGPDLPDPTETSDPFTS